MYIEDLLALNFFMNTSLLFLTARLMGRMVTKKRLLAGGFISALYSLAIFLPASAVIFSWVGKIIASVIVVVFTFKPQRLAELMRLCGAFFLTSFFLAGTIFALYFFSNAPAIIRGGVFYLETPRPGMLFGGVLIALSLMLAVWHFSERQRKRKSFQMSLVICEDKHRVKVNALVDTGNQLRDPFSGKPLCVASCKALYSLLPEALAAAYEQGDDPVAALSTLESQQQTCFGIAPYRTLENVGMLVTYRPSLVLLEHGKFKEVRKDIVFALSTRPLSLDNDVEVLLHPFVLESIGGVTT